MFDAVYEVKPNINVYTQLVVSQGRDTESCWVSAGFRQQNDATLPVGASVIFKGSSLEANVDYRVQYRGVVDRTQRAADKVIHHLTPLQRETLTYRRGDPRFALDMGVKRREGLAFEILNVSHNGVRFMYRSSDSLTSASLDRPMTLCLSFNGQEVPIDCQIRNVSYNWWTQNHCVGARFINVMAEHKAIINQLIVLALEQKKQKQRQTLMNQAVTLPEASKKVLFSPQMADTEVLHQEARLKQMKSALILPPQVPTVPGDAFVTKDNNNVIDLEPRVSPVTMIDPETGRIVRM